MSMSISPINAAASWWTQEVSQSVANSQSASTSTPDASNSTSTPNAANLASVFQQFSVDLQSMLTEAQATSPATGTTTASNATSDITGQPTTQQPGGVQHHHHHHHGGGSAQSAANQFVSQIAQLVEGGGASSTSGQTTGNTLAADVMQALQSYGAFGSKQTTSTVSTTA